MLGFVAVYCTKFDPSSDSFAHAMARGIMACTQSMCMLPRKDILAKPMYSSLEIYTVRR
jgi:hypothetical protein